MTSELVRIEIAGVTITVPVYGDVMHTRRLAAEVTRRISQIEQQSTKVDTQAFALAAALSFAADLNKSQEDRAQDTRALLRTLDKILTELRAILKSVDKSRPIPPSHRPGTD